MTKITTNETVVSSLSKEMLQATQEVNVSLKKSISYSNSQAVTTLKFCLSDRKKATQEFQTGVDTDVKNLKKIHEAIKKTDQEWGGN
ncbi:DUF3130 family protein [Carnobacterium divergens]|uniref:DUF3130 family protein n=1 Tax=Carnobacterium divergens TaxID=2748 RepID=UPI00128CDD6F|nr:DUF3130 family protein [Carnobacterium divergens]MPQ22782.1 DUF3130 family protein [Carnobacterium divergens]